MVCDLGSYVEGRGCHGGLYPLQDGEAIVVMLSHLSFHLPLPLPYLHRLGVSPHLETLPLFLGPLAAPWGRHQGFLKEDDPDP